MRGTGERVFERVGQAEHDLILVVFVIAAVLSMAGTYWHMRAKMRPAGRDETTEAARPAPAAPREHRGPTTGAAARGWAYETDAAGRPRRFLSHREAAWWAARRVGTFFLPLLAPPVLWALFGAASPGRWLAALLVVAAVACVWLTVVGTVYLYLALSGGVMGKAERRRRGGEGNGGRA
jgi:hypothetical protein